MKITLATKYGMYTFEKPIAVYIDGKILEIKKPVEKPAKKKPKKSK